MIVSYTEGRIRLRFQHLKETAAASEVKKYLEAIDGIKKVEIKLLTGSILIEYDHAVLPPEVLFEKGKQELKKHGINLEIPTI